MPARPRRILIFQLGSIGDTIVSLPAIRAVRRHFGSAAELTLLHERTESASTPADVIGGLGLVDRFVSYPARRSAVGRAIAWARLWMTLRLAGFDAAVYLAPGERPAPSVARDRRFFRAAGIRRLIGFHSVPASALYPRDGAGKPTAVEHETTTRLSRLERDGIDIEVESAPSARGLDLPEAIVRTARPWLADRRRHADRRLVAIAPGAKQQTNLWPIERFAEVGRSLLARGDVELVVVGGPAEREAANALLAAWDDGVNATGMLSVLETAAVLRECVLLVGLDTGTTHLAAAVDTPCVALYGGRDNPGRFDPLGDAHRILRHAVPCAGCRIILDPCPLPDHPCMRGIETDEVIAAAMEALA